MSQASYSLVNENNLSLRPAGEWDSELSDTIQFRDRSRGNKLVTPTFAIAQEEVPKSLAQEFPLPLMSKEGWHSTRSGECPDEF